MKRESNAVLGTAASVTLALERFSGNAFRKEPRNKAPSSTGLGDKPRLVREFLGLCYEKRDGGWYTFELPWSVDLLTCSMANWARWASVQCGKDGPVIVDHLTINDPELRGHGIGYGVAWSPG